MKKIIYLLCVLSLQDISFAMDSDDLLSVPFQELNNDQDPLFDTFYTSFEKDNFGLFNDPGFSPEDPLVPSSLPVVDQDQLKLDLPNNLSTVSLPMEDLTSENNTNTTCPYCKKEWPSVSQLKRHIRTHTGERPFECGICGKRFTQDSNLNTHKKKIHSESGNSFDNLYDDAAPANLQSHVAPFQNATNTVCTVCDKQCKYPSTLRLHMTTHSKEKHYPCEICRKSFKTPSILKFHKKKCGEKHR